MARADMITLGIAQGEDHLRRLGFAPAEMKKIITRAVNRSLLAARTELVRETTSHYAVPSAAVRSLMAIAKASGRVPYGRVRMRGKGAIPLAEWNAKQTKKGISVRILKNEGKKTITGAFRHGNTVFRRKGKDRYPIRKLYGPGLVTHVLKPEVTRDMQNRASEIFLKRIEHEARQMLAKKVKP